MRRRKRAREKNFIKQLNYVENDEATKKQSVFI